MRPMNDPGRGYNDQESGSNNARPPPDSPIDVLGSTSLRTMSDAEKNEFLQNIGFLFGMSVDGIDGPRRSMRPVAIRAHGPGRSPFIREMNDIITETVTTKCEREANYAHQGWSLAAVSVISPWTSSRIASNNRPNSEGSWITKRTIVQRVSLEIQREELIPAQEFVADVQTALEKPTLCERFQAVYHTLHTWGDVVPLGIDVGISLSFTDLESNIIKLPTTGSYNNLRDLLAIRTLQIIKRGGDTTLPDWSDEGWPKTAVPPLQWSQVRVTRVVPTISLLSKTLQDQVIELYAKRLSFAPILAVKTTEGYRTLDDAHNASKTALRITIRAHSFIDCLSVRYLDRTYSYRHGGGGGTEHQFTLADGEHVTELMIWSNRDWVCGLQLITNTGRVSPHYGGTGGTPAIARCKGAVLVGFSSMIRMRPGSGSEMISGIQGIWRCDLLDKVPNEADVFSNYLGGEGGTPFNDRAVVRSSSAQIQRIDIGSGDIVDSMQLAYIDRSNGGNLECMTPRHGGLGGAMRSFVLESGEYITLISGRHSDRGIHQLSFGTSKGRNSGAHGGSGGQYFSISAPLDKHGNHMRLRYICGKSNSRLDGIMFIWAPV